jgi:hypothetical protein
VTARVWLELPPEIREALWRQLLPRAARPLEEAAFLFAHAEQGDETVVFRFADWLTVGPEGFRARSPYHLELTDEARAGAIKRAHDLGASLAEVHSHTFPGIPRFSPSDIAGLREFVPHVWWRLRHRPYLALVVSASGFDGLAWIENAEEPQHLEGIVSDGVLLRPSRATSLEENSNDGSL